MAAVNITQLLATYITALHILHYHGILDGYGHMSLRNPENASTFYMFHTGAPALVSSLDDIALYQVSDAEPAEPNGPTSFIERFIHSEVLKHYPGINVVLHGHPDILVSYSIIEAPLRATIHMAGYLGQRTPVFDISRHYLPNDTQDLLVDNERLGAALAAEFSDGDTHEAQDLPDHELVLMQSHGFTSCGVELEKVVYQAIYAKTNAAVESEALRIQHAYTGSAAGEERGGDRGIVYMNSRQARDTWATIGRDVSRPWGLWKRQVQVDPLYVNDLDS
ncbi:Methylthioribulose-1-phosphate dehydratase [Madurella mycetomatis]|uniref:Methylthioribulose-1-phosphate dehydratase n=1 Tax=Madurella mycetomatis TaxID=100816 RepID=A0A175WD98_9PEZI|nr:Methylthioribulose-1-phosphate dehydratase [Madurella mycetomatis]